MALQSPVNPNPTPVPGTNPAMDPATTMALIQALSRNQGLETLQFLQQSGLTRNIQSSPRNLGGAENPSLQQQRGESGPFFRSETDRQARIANSPASRAPSLISSSSPTFNSRFGGPGIRPTPQPALGSPENPFVGPDGLRTVVTPNGSLASGGNGNLPFMSREFNMAGNEELAPFMENANGVYANPQGYEGALAQTGAMDAQALRQGQIQEQLRGYLGANPQRSGLPQQVPDAKGYSLDDLADGPTSGGVVRQETPSWAKMVQKGGSGPLAKGKGSAEPVPNPFATEQPAAIPGQVIPGQSDSQIPMIRNVYNAGEGAMGGLAWLADILNQYLVNPMAQQVGLPGFEQGGNQKWMKEQWSAPDPQDWTTFFLGK